RCRDRDDRHGAIQLVGAPARDHPLAANLGVVGSATASLPLRVSNCSAIATKVTMIDPTTPRIPNTGRAWAISGPGGAAARRLSVTVTDRTSQRNMARRSGIANARNTSAGYAYRSC